MIAMSKQKHMLTTIDNPFNPLTQFSEWYSFDTAKGYNSLSLLARLAQVSDSLGDDHTLEVIEETILEIVQENVSGMHTMVLIEEE